MATKKEEVQLTAEEQIAALQAQIAEKNQLLADQEGIINDQTEALKAAEAQGAGALPVVTHEGKRYKVLARKFTFGTRKVDANTLKSDKDLVKELIEKGSGILKEVE